jgi:hypothetical protein
MIFYSSLRDAYDDVGPEAAGKDAVFVTSPDYFAVRLMKMTKAVEHKPSPARYQTLQFGPEQVTIERPSDKSLVLTYAGGAMHEAAVTKAKLDLYRSIKRPMVKGQTVELSGLHVEVLELTQDGRPLRVRFDFEEPLEAPRYRFYDWEDNHFRPLEVPKIGETKVLPRAELTAALPR